MAKNLGDFLARSLSIVPYSSIQYCISMTYSSQQNISFCHFIVGMFNFIVALFRWLFNTGENNKDRNTGLLKGG